MLRITNNTPGVLDLSPIRDEAGLVVALNGPSYRDVPDHEGDNPILQRVVAAGWATVAKVPVEATDEPVLTPLETPPITEPASEAPQVTEPTPETTGDDLVASNDGQPTDNAADGTPHDVTPPPAAPAAKPERKSSRRT